MGESEQRYQELIQSSPAPINLFDSSGEIIWGNNAVLDLLGLDSQDELIGCSIFDFIHIDDQYMAESELAEVVTSKESTGPTEMRLTPREGKDRMVRVATAPGQYKGEDIGQAVVIDITELNQVKSELEKERDFIEMALDTIEDVFYVINTAGDLERWNNTLFNVTGYTLEEAQTLDVEDFFIEKHADKVSKSISRAFANGGDSIEATVRTKSGEQIPYEFRKRRLVKDDVVIGLVGIGRDISQQQSREQHIKTIDHILRHHLRNQLNIIQGNTDLLTGQGGNQNNQQITAICKSVDKMLSIFNQHQHIVPQILLKKDREQIDIIAVLNELFTEFEAQYPLAELVLVGPDSASVVATPDINRAFQILIFNSIDNNNSELPKLTIIVDAESTPVTIRLTDNGPTLSKFEYEFIDDPATLNSTSHPTGLGLWAANLAVTYSRGSFTIEEGDESGNDIIIELPTPINEWEE